VCGLKTGNALITSHVDDTLTPPAPNAFIIATPGVRRSLTAASGGGSFKRALGPANGATPVGSFKLAGGAQTPG